MVLQARPLSSMSYGDSYGESGNELVDAFRILQSVPAGKQILERAEKNWGATGFDELVEHFELGEVSRTDAVLTRHFNAKTGVERRERQVKVILKRDQPLLDLALDMAHELTHAVSPPSWDPYDPELTPGKYLAAALEAPGGEVEAVYMECRVGLELSIQRKILIPRCKRYLSRDRMALDREKIKKDFYRVGSWKKEVQKQLGHEQARFPLLSEDAPKLFSSTGGAPYPVSLIREFHQLNQVACENARKRANARSLASVNDSMVRRCQSF